MDQIISFFNQIPQESLYSSLLFFMYLTALGVIPSNSDLTTWVLSGLAGAGKIDPLMVYIIIITGIIVADHTSFFMGKFLGTKVLKWKKMQKKFPIEKQQKIRDLMEQSPLKVLLLIRFTIVARPILIILVSSTGFHLKLFSKVYTPIVLVYTGIIFLIGYHLAKFSMDLPENYLVPFVVMAILGLLFFYTKMIRRVMTLLK
jgi:membrane protein DedA with SNARE-associated domain